MIGDNCPPYDLNEQIYLFTPINLFVSRSQLCLFKLLSPTFQFISLEVNRLLLEEPSKVVLLAAAVETFCGFTMETLRDETGSFPTVLYRK